MKILNSISPVFDLNGNFYLLYNTELYEFSINNKNHLELYQIFKNDNFNYNILDEECDNFPEIKKLHLLSKSNTLKSKIIREYIKECDDEFDENKDNTYNEENELDDDTINEIHKNMQYYPEDLELEYDSNNYDIDYDDNQLKFTYYGEGDEVKLLNEIDTTEINENNATYVCDHDNSLNISSYDTYLYEGDREHSNLAFVSKLNHVNSSYRLFLTQDGNIVLKVVGANRVNYKLKIDEKLILEVI